MARPSRSTPYWLVWWLLLAGGAILRLWQLGRESFWLDEVFSARIVIKPWGLILDSLPKDKPPLDYYVQALFTRLGDNAEFWNRLPEAIAGIVTLPAVWFMAKQVVGRRWALVAMAVASFNTMLVYYSQEARPYSLFTCLLCWQTAFFFQWWRLRRANRMPRAQARCLGLLFLFSALMVYTLYAGLIVLGTQVLALALAAIPNGSRRAPRAVAAWSALQIVLLSGIVVVLALPLRNRVEFHAPPNFFFQFQGLTPGTIADISIAFFGWKAGLLPRVPAGILAFAPVAVGLVVAARRRPQVALYLFLAGVVSAYGILFLYVKMERMYASRYSIYGVPPTILVYTFALIGLSRALPRRGLVWAIVAVYAIVGSCLYKANQPYRHNWRDALKVIADKGKPADRVVVPGNNERVIAGYYLRRFGRHDIVAVTQAQPYSQFNWTGTWMVSVDLSDNYQRHGFSGVEIERRSEDEPAGSWRNLAAQLSQPGRVSMGAAPKELFGAGWSTTEVWSPEISVRWVTETDATVFLPADRTGPGKLTIHLLPLSTDAMPVQELTVLVNGRAVYSGPLEKGGLRDVIADVPAGFIIEGYNHITLHFAWIHSPSLDKASYADFRQLAAAVESISWEAAP